MDKVLFLVTELHKPVGGLYRYSIEFLENWRQLAREGKTKFEPFVLSLRGLAEPLGELKPSPFFAELCKREKKFKVFEAERGGGTVYFLEGALSGEEKNAFHGCLWEEYRINSLTASYWDYYSQLNAFWKYVPDVAEFAAARLAKDGERIAVVDAQDWLAFPAGFLVKKRLGVPLVCRFHSGEFGRSLGRPDADSAPLSVEAAALMEADFVQSVSATEAKFEIYNLLPLKMEVEKQLAASRDGKWIAQQDWKNERYQDFLLLEAEDAPLFGRSAAGFSNGIVLDEWKTISRRDIGEGKRLFGKLLPNNSKKILFIGRTETRKGIGALIEALALMKDDAVGLLLASSFNPESFEKYSKRIKELGLEGRAVIHDSWVDERKKMQLFCAADAIALPSFYEPFGIVTLEAFAADMACEKNGVVGPVVVVGDTGGMHEVVRNGVNGFKVPMEEFDLKPALLARILDMALGDDELRREISGNGCRSVQSPSFDWREIVGRTMLVYDKAIANRALLEKIGGEKMPTVDEKFGNEAGKVWLALKDSEPLSMQEVKRKSKLNDFFAGAGMGWLAREGKVRLEGKTGNKFALNE